MSRWVLFDAYEETIKDESKFYDLTEILNALDGSSDLSISITSEDVVEPISEE